MQSATFIVEGAPMPRRAENNGDKVNNLLLHLGRAANTLSTSKRALPLEFPQQYSLPFVVQEMLRALFPDPAINPALSLAPANVIHLQPTAREYKQYQKEGSFDVRKFLRSKRGSIQDHHDFMVLTRCIPHKRRLDEDGADVTVKVQDPPKNHCRFDLNGIEWAVCGVGRHVGHFDCGHCLAIFLDPSSVKSKPRWGGH
ncbi:hypothetical protein BCR44DRAFT_1442210 [Catenaria anguillulae PL171]|uniref:Uncharacterized protein n=1 Tax=Catenaria anguillulae PL171 TaxID=765915 RepID=A0A1Y2HCV2_9FUNG|nr:hypothetical protein BCR44DRAFT_1442210 [Catenaria anguillulae PL171]